MDHTTKGSRYSLVVSITKKTRHNNNPNARLFLSFYLTTKKLGSVKLNLLTFIKYNIFVLRGTKTKDTLQIISIINECT